MIEKVSENKKYVKFLTYGCQMNFSDAERMEGELAKIGYEPTESMEQADLIIPAVCGRRQRTRCMARLAKSRA